MAAARRGHKTVFPVFSVILKRMGGERTVQRLINFSRTHDMEGRNGCFVFFSLSCTNEGNYLPKSPGCTEDIIDATVKAENV